MQALGVGMTRGHESGRMRALVCDAWGAPDALRLGDIAPPIPAATDVLMDVRVATANFADVLMIAGRYQTRPELPFVPGLEAAGVIVEAPRGLSVSPGDRAVAVLWHGGFADVVRAAAIETFVIPSRMPFEVAAALPNTYASAGLALLDVGHLEFGETLLVHGAGGGVGTAAIQIGKAMGARVIAVASTAEKRALALHSGADLILASETPDWMEATRAFTGGRGVDVCFDPVGGAITDPSLSALGWGGRYLVFGFASGEMPPIRANRLLVKNRAMLGSSLRHFRLHRPDRLQAMMARLFTWWETGLVAPTITQRYPLERAAEALNELAARRARGKIAIYIKDSLARARSFEKT